MNKIEKMIEMQKALDSYIEKENNCEINDIKLTLALIDELGELTHELKGDWCWWKKTQKPVDQAKVLEELVDVWHFAMSYHYKFTEDKVEEDIFGRETTNLLLFIFEKHLLKNTTEKEMRINRTNYAIEGLLAKVKKPDEDEASIFYYLTFLTNALDFTLEDVYKAYTEKNKENYERQKRGY